MQPHLSLVYNSQAGNGLMGRGWSIGGLSAISRCSQTLAQDNVRGAIHLNADDRYCLDGERLVLASGAYGQPGSEYRTEKESFSRIRAFGATDGGVAYFIVQTKAGLWMEYGGTGDSRFEAPGTAKVKAWAINRIVDRPGNYINFNYSEETTDSSLYPIRVAYGNHSQETGSLSFTYESRPDAAATYFAGYRASTRARLSQVTVRRDVLLRTYALAYHAQPGPSELYSIQMCAASGECLRPTEFRRSPRTTGFLDNFVHAHGGGADDNLTADFNGDGKSDLAGYAGNGQWNICLATGDGNDFDCGASLWAGPGSDTRNTLVGDFDGDGKADLAGFNPQGLWHVCLARAGGFSCAYWAATPDVGSVGNSITGDFDGDGRTDIASPLPAPAPPGAWYVCRSRGDGFNCGFWLGHTAGLDRNIMGDFNGDGLTDIAGDTGQNGTWHVCLSTGVRFNCSLQQAHGFSRANTVTADFNGDGLTDMAAYNQGASQWEVCLSTGTGFACSGWGGHAQGIAENIVGDFNGDGLADMAAQTASPGTWAVCLSAGDRFQPCMAQHAHAAGGRVTGDFDGDGRTDLIGYSGGSGIWHLNRSVYAGSAITAINQGFVEFDIEYKTLSAASDLYTRGTSAAYPEIDLQIPMQAVWEVKTVGPLPSARRYAYGGLKADIRGRGNLGFRWMTSEDITPGSSRIKEYSEYSQAWPHIGQITGSRTTMPGAANDHVVAVARHVIATGTGNTPNSVFAYISQSARQGWDLNGAALPAERTDFEYSQNPQYGDPTRVITDTGGQIKVLTNTYAPVDIAGNNWITGRLSRSSVVHRAPAP